MDKHTAVQSALNSIQKEYGGYFDLDLHESVRRHLHMMYMVGFEQRGTLHKGNPIVRVINGTLVGEYLNMADAARRLGYTPHGICDCIHKKTKQYKGCQWYKLKDWERMEKENGVGQPESPTPSLTCTDT